MINTSSKTLEALMKDITTARLYKCMAVATLYSVIGLESDKAWRDVAKESSDAAMIWC